MPVVHDKRGRFAPGQHSNAEKLAGRAHVRQLGRPDPKSHGKNPAVQQHFGGNHSVKVWKTQIGFHIDYGNGVKTYHTREGLADAIVSAAKLGNKYAKPHIVQKMLNKIDPPAHLASPKFENSVPASAMGKTSPIGGMRAFIARAPLQPAASVAQTPKPKSRPKWGNVEAVLAELERPFRTAPNSLSSPDLKMHSSESIGEGVTGASRAVLRDQHGNEHEVVWKTSKAEVEAERVHGTLRPGIAHGTFYQREAAASDVDKIIDGPSVVPETVVRTFKGEEGSAQAWVKGGVLGKEIREQLRGEAFDHATQLMGGHQVTAESAHAALSLVDKRLGESMQKLGSTPHAQKQLLLDLITGNDDRHGGNTMWVKHGSEWRPNSIDNGLTFPEGPNCQFLFAMPNPHYARAALNFGHEVATAARTIDLPKMAEALKKHKDITEEQIHGALVRAQSLKNDPHQLHHKFERIAAKKNGKQIEQGTLDVSTHVWTSRHWTQRVKDGEVTQQQVDELRALAKRTP